MIVIDGGVIALIIIVFLTLVGRSLYLRSTGLKSVKQLKKKVVEQENLLEDIRRTALVFSQDDTLAAQQSFADWTANHILAYNRGELDPSKGTIRK